MQFRLKQIVPRLIIEVDGHKLKKISTICVNGHTWKVLFDEKIGFLSDLRDMLKKFNVVSLETIVLKIDGGLEFSRTTERRLIMTFVCSTLNIVDVEGNLGGRW